MDNALDVSIVIVSWNVADLLRECLHSLVAALAGVKAEVIVVDNASQDSSVDMVRRDFAWVKLLCNEENVGFARASNQALRIARGRYALLLNPDTVVPPDTVESLVAFMDAHPEAGAAGCKQIHANGKVQHTYHRMISLSRETKIALGLAPLFPRWVDYGALPLRASGPSSVDWVDGACLIVRRALCEQMGFLDENLFLFAEDVDLCWRVRTRGYQVYFVPHVHIVHHRGQSVARSRVSEVSGAILLARFCNRRYLLRKHFGATKAVVYPVVVILDVLRRLVQGAFVRSEREAQSAYVGILRAVIRGKLRLETARRG